MPAEVCGPGSGCLYRHVLSNLFWPGPTENRALGNRWRMSIAEIVN